MTHDQKAVFEAHPGGGDGETMNGRNKYWREARWDKRQPERLAHIFKGGEEDETA